MSVITLSSLLLLVVLFNSGCEVGSATETIYISPSSVEVKQGQSVQFTADGGYEYTWSLSASGNESSLGKLSSTTGRTVTYTSLYNPVGSNAVTETLTVTSTIQGGSSSTNSSSATQGTGTATITHIGSSETPTETETTSQLSITPNAAAVTNGQSQLFQASGGGDNATYVWSLSTVAYGYISSSGSNCTFYNNFTSTNATVNQSVTLTVQSGSLTPATATITAIHQ